MVLVNPFLLAGKDQILQYQEDRVRDWTEKKNQEPDTFKNYMDEVIDQWDVPMSDTIANTELFDDINGIDSKESLAVFNALKKTNVLNEYGYVNLAQTDVSMIISALDQLSFLTTDQKTAITTVIQELQQNLPVDYETFTQTMFVFKPSDPDQSAMAIDEDTSAVMWKALNTHGVIDDYGILQFDPNSKELTNAVNEITDISPYQRLYALSLLNKHPDISYYSYIQEAMSAHESAASSNESSALPVAGVYLPNEAKKAFNPLTLEELNHIRTVAVLEWNVMLISQKSIHSSRKKSMEKAKEEKRTTQMENEKYLAQLEAQHKQRQRENQKTTVRVMTQDAGVIGRLAANVGDVTHDSHHDIRKRHKELSQQIKAKDSETGNHVHTNPDKVSKAQSMVSTAQTAQHKLYTPRFKWEQNQSTASYDIIPTETARHVSPSFNTPHSTQHMLSILGYRIDVSKQVGEFKQKLQTLYIESKSHNPIIAKFSELKFWIYEPHAHITKRRYRYDRNPKKRGSAKGHRSKQR